MKLRNETKVGLLAFVSLILLIVGYSLISGNAIFSSTHHYYSVYNRINGLQVSNPVFLKGYQVGEVEEINILDPRKPSILVKFTVKNEIEIPKGSKAQIYSSGILGSMAVQLLIDKKSESFYKPGDTLIGGHQMSLTESISSQISPLRKKSVNLIATFDTLISTINTIMREGGQEDLQRSLTSFRRSINSLAKTAQRLDTFVLSEKNRLSQILENTKSITQNIEEQNQAINNSIQNVSSITDSLAAANLKRTLDRADSALMQINRLVSKVNKGKGSVGKMLNDDDLYENLESSSRRLDSLINDIRNNPARYINFSVLSISKNKSGKKK